MPIDVPDFAALIPSDFRVSAATDCGIQLAQSCNMPDPELAAVEEVQREGDAAASAEAEGDPKTAPDAPKSKKTIVIVVVAVVVVAVAVGGIAMVKKRSAKPAKQEPSAAVAATLPLETFVVNLAGTERAYLRVTITLGLAHPMVKEKQETGLPVPLVRDTILTVLSTAQPDQLLQTEGKSQLKAQLLQALQTRLPELGVKDIYFTEFLVQM